MKGVLVVMAAAALGAAGCESSPTSPSAAPVRVTVTQNPTFSGDSLVFSMRVENITQTAVDLTFPSGCDVLPYFSDSRTGQAVTPVGGGFACTAVIMQRQLLPGEIIVRSVVVKVGTTPDAVFIVLPAGDYRIHARLEDQKYRTESEKWAFSLR